MAAEETGIAACDVVLLAGGGDSTNAVYHALREATGSLGVVVEESEPRPTYLRRRARRLGWLHVAGQVMFVGGAVPVLRWRARTRTRSILRDAGLDASPIPEGEVWRVPSVNSPECRALLRRLAPAVVVVNGTRIISDETLRCVEAVFVNMHAGITPRYRGVHGGYWALVEGHPDLVGTTVHLVDTGIDTGGVVAQATFTPGPDDNFATYPYLHLAAGVPLLIDAVRKVLGGVELSTVDSIAVGQLSRLYYHPTIWGYLKARARKSIR